MYSFNEIREIKVPAIMNLKFKMDNLKFLEADLASRFSDDEF